MSGRSVRKRGKCVCLNNYDGMTDADLIIAKCSLDGDSMWPGFASRIRPWIKLTISVTEEKIEKYDLKRLIDDKDSLTGFYGSVILKGKLACRIADIMSMTGGMSDLECVHEVQYIP